MVVSTQLVSVYCFVVKDIWISMYYILYCLAIKRLCSIVTKLQTLIFTNDKIVLLFFQIKLLFSSTHTHTQTCKQMNLIAMELVLKLIVFLVFIGRERTKYQIS